VAPRWCHCHMNTYCEDIWWREAVRQVAARPGATAHESGMVESSAKASLRPWPQRGVEAGRARQGGGRRQDR